MGPSRIAGRYELQEQLGEGGMGVVWRALDAKTGGAVAIKLMKDISDPLAVELFTKEWRTLAELSHPNIVDVRDVDVIEENRQKKPFFVMPLLRGATLGELIENASARLSCARIVEIITQVCRGLQAAHQRGLVHRDMKPSNIFVMDDDTAKIIDFGVVHLAGSKSVTGQKGTFQYMSPEQAQMKEITPASDLFSLGVILYEAFTLRKPFARPTAEETIQAIVKYVPPSVSEINPSINQSMSMVVHKCLAKQPIHRFASARELAETLQKALRNEPVFDPGKIEPRINRAKSAFKSGDEAFASEILGELEAEGHLDPRITVLRMQIDTAVRQKKIRQLLEGARARMEQEEVPLALDKLREVLELDPGNSDALAMREAMAKQRSEAQIAKWFELAETHLGNRDFSSARHAAEQVLAIRRGDPRALDLLEKIESTQAEAVRIREQKEHLYSSAMVAYQNGEIETALSKLERLFSVARANPNAAIPERDAVYQSFYKEIRSERDGIRAALEDAQRQFSDKKFAEAMVICRELLTKYPNDGTFQALKIRIEDAEGQELSSYIAEVSKRVESEPDLDRRANILREACERYPSEAQFAQQLKLVRERRDLVNSIVAKARQYDERRQYAEAISQWDILRNIYSQYPGIVIELEQCKKKRDRQVREEEQARVVEEIDRLIQNRAYAKAIESADTALEDFPAEPEISGLRTLAEQGLQRTQESRRLLESAQQACAEKDFPQAAEFLRKSNRLDQRSPGVKDMLVEVLTQQARELVDTNWQAAEPLYHEANELDPNNPSVRALRSSISEAKRQTFVGQCLTECRALVAAGNMRAAADRLRSARADYPNDVRLEQYQAGLQREINEVEQQEEKGRDRAALGQDRMVLEQSPDRARARAVLERSYAIRAKHPDDPEIGQAVADIELTVKRVAKVEDLSQLLGVETASTGTDGRAAAVAPARVPDQKKKPKLVDFAGEKTRLFPVEDQKTKKPGYEDYLRRAGDFVRVLAKQVVAIVRPEGNWSKPRIGIVGGTIGLILFVPLAIFVIRHLPPKPPPVLPPTSLLIRAIPPDSTITVAGNVITDGKAEVGKTIEVSHLGYQTQRVLIQKDFNGEVTLIPEELQLSVETAAKGGTVSLDGNPIDTNGSVGDHPLAPDDRVHTLTLPTDDGKNQTIEFKPIAGSRPQVNKLETSSVFVVTTLGSSATIYGPAKTVSLGEQTITVDPAGTDFSFSEQNNELTLDQGSVVLQVANAPELLVHSLAAASGQLVITANVDTAKLTMDGAPVARHGKGWVLRNVTGAHKFVLSADDYEAQTWAMAVQAGHTVRKNIALIPITLQQLPASLSISGGTPGTDVILDGVHAGMLDGNGHLVLPNSLAPGRHHSLLLTKALYESRTVDIGPSGSEFRIATAALIPWPTVTFLPEPPNATVKLRHEGAAEFADVPASGIQLQPGAKYDVVAEAPGYDRWSKEITVPHETTNIPVKLLPIPKSEPENPGSVSVENGWYRSKSPSQFVGFNAAPLPKNLMFYRPGKILLWDKKVEWLIETPQKTGHIQYTLEGHKLTRKLVIGDKTSNQKQFTNVNAQSVQHTPVLSVHINANGNGVLITNDIGAVLDEFKVQDYDFSSPRIAVRTDSLFVLRSDQ